MRHLLDIESLSKDELLLYLATAHEFISVSKREIKKVPTLRGKTVINMFLEPSTRTRTSFEIAGKRLSADTINVSGSSSAVVKGESLYDTIRTLEAMNPDAVVVRHGKSGAPHFLAQHSKNTAIINAGDGMHEHPTQALLDCLTLLEHYDSDVDQIQGLNVAIVGDIYHSRVARSNVWAHKLLGNKVRLVGPPTLVPEDMAEDACFGKDVDICWDLREGIEGADVVMVLRMQKERQSGYFVPSIREYAEAYCVTSKLVDELAPDSVVMHPGPANRGIEISGELIDSGRALVENQVEHGVAVRMATLFSLCLQSEEEEVADASN